MTGIARSYDPETNIVIFVLQGRTEVDELMKIADEHFLQYPLSMALWDLRNADLSEFGMQDLERVARRSAEVRSAAENPRSAYVVDDSTKRLLVKLYSAVADKDNSTVGLHAFETVEDAMNWLMSGIPDDRAGSIAG